MKPNSYFVVEMDKRLNDSIKMNNGTEIYVDTRFDEFKYRINEAPVVACPFNYDTGVRPGDTLYFHHLVVINEGQPLTGFENHYLVRYATDATINNQAIAYKDQDTGEIHPLGGWSVLEPVDEDKSLKSDLIEIVELEEKLPTKGRVAFTSPAVEELGLSVGDVVGFRENMDYRFKIDDKEYYRTRAEDLLYVEA